MIARVLAAKFERKMEQVETSFRDLFQEHFKEK